MRGLLALRSCSWRAARFSPSGAATAKKAVARAGRRRAEAALRVSGRLAEAREPDRGAGLLPRLAARSADLADRRPVEQHQLGQRDRSYLESFVWQETGRRRGRRRAAREPARLSRAGRRSRPAARRQRQHATPVLRRPGTARSPPTGSRRASTRSTRTRTRGTYCCSGGTTARSTRSPSTSRRRSTTDKSCGT